MRFLEELLTIAIYLNNITVNFLPLFLVKQKEAVREPPLLLKQKNIVIMAPLIRIDIIMIPESTYVEKKAFKLLT